MVVWDAAVRTNAAVIFFLFRGDYFFSPSSSSSSSSSGINNVLLSSSKWCVPLTNNCHARPDRNEVGGYYYHGVRTLFHSLSFFLFFLSFQKGELLCFFSFHVEITVSGSLVRDTRTICCRSEPRQKNVIAFFSFWLFHSSRPSEWSWEGGGASLKVDDGKSRITFDRDEKKKNKSQLFPPAAFRLLFSDLLLLPSPLHLSVG